jgi:hypothetical protein
MLKVVNAGIAHLVCEANQKDKRTTIDTAHLLGSTPLPKAEFVATHIFDLLKGVVSYFDFDKANDLPTSLNRKVKVIANRQLA